MTWEEEIQAAWATVKVALPGARLERADHGRTAIVVMPSGRWMYLAIAPTSDHVRRLVRDLTPTEIEALNEAARASLAALSRKEPLQAQEEQGSAPKVS